MGLGGPPVNFSCLRRMKLDYFSKWLQAVGVTALKYPNAVPTMVIAGTDLEIDIDIH